MVNIFNVNLKLFRGKPKATKTSQNLL